MFTDESKLEKQFLEDIEQGARQLGIDVPPTGPGTHFGLTAVGAGNLVSLVLTNVELADADTDPLTATGDALDEIRVADGLPKLAPTAATGVLITTALGVVDLPAGLQFQGPGGSTGITTEHAGNGSQLKTTLAIPFALQTTGVSGYIQGTQIKFNNAPLNLATSGNVWSLTDGTNEEGDDHKRFRILNRRMYPARGGNWAHLRETALNVPGVDDAYVYPALGGGGSVRVVLLQNGSASNDWKRAVDSSIVTAARDAFDAAFPTESERYSVVSATEQFVDVVIRATYMPKTSPTLQAYQDAFLVACSKLGPGENITDRVRLKRSCRHPVQGAAAVGSIVISQPWSISSLQLAKVQEAFPEIMNLQFDSITATAPNVPGSIRLPPNVLRVSSVTFGVIAV